MRRSGCLKTLRNLARAGYRICLDNGMGHSHFDWEIMPVVRVPSAFPSYSPGL
jgi:hypothetical protein